MTQIIVTVVYALPDRASEIELKLCEGATVAQALSISGIAALHPDADIARCPVGIFGKVIAKDAVLADGDRIEVYRPLQADPKDLRRRRATRGPAR